MADPELFVITEFDCMYFLPNNLLKKKFGQLNFGTVKALSDDLMNHKLRMSTPT